MSLRVNSYVSPQRSISMSLRVNSYISPEEHILLVSFNTIIMMILSGTLCTAAQMTKISLQLNLCYQVTYLCCYATAYPNTPFYDLSFARSQSIIGFNYQRHLQESQVKSEQVVCVFNRVTLSSDSTTSSNEIDFMGKRSCVMSGS